jgi:putative PIN family toxin of toxin-antitoxin system
MLTNDPFDVVIDTNVVFEGLTKRDSGPGLVITAWFLGEIQVHVSNTLVYEYYDVLSRKLSTVGWSRVESILSDMLAQAIEVRVYYTWRPNSPDPADEHLVDCAINAAAAIVTSNVRHFEMARRELGLQVMTPVELLTRLSER